MSAVKLQKLVYYAQAWSLVWDEKPMFDERIEAWANGPVVPALYERHRGRYLVAKNDIGGDCRQLSPEAEATVDAVLKFYGDKDPQWLSNLTHMEAPWLQARRGIPDGVRCQNEISLESMAEYYSSI